MQQYLLKPHPAKRYLIEVEYRFNAPQDDPVLQMPYWRPGRYQAGNFVSNVIGLRVYRGDAQIKAPKTSPNQWCIRAKRGDELCIRYTCYADKLSAGDTFWNRERLMVNPVNALVFAHGTEEQPSEIYLQLPEPWQTSTSMESVEADRPVRAFRAENLQELLDSPILAAPDLLQLEYQCDGTRFCIDICGEVAFDPDRLTAHFQAFTQTQIAAFGSFPVDTYRFLLVFPNHRAYHGVEHERSTAIVIGPAEELQGKKRYGELLGISSHELYHTWNVKRFRPAEWSPYNFSNASPSRLGYVAEGVTTYMGDKMLWQSGVYSDAEFLTELANQLRKHLQNQGRFNLSLADASIDTWVDGYGRGTPSRRVSIYTEGALLAAVADLWLLEATGGRHDLSTAMKRLYENTDPDKGYTEQQYWDTLASVAPEANLPWSELRDKVLDDTGHLEGFFREVLAGIGLEISFTPPTSYLKDKYGLHLEIQNNKAVVWNIAPGSPAERSGLWFDDCVTEINEAPATEFLTSESAAFPVSLRMAYVADHQRKRASLELDGKSYFPDVAIAPASKADPALFERWKNTLRPAAQPH